MTPAQHLESTLSSPPSISLAPATISVFISSVISTQTIDLYKFMAASLISLF